MISITHRISSPIVIIVLLLGFAGPVASQAGGLPLPVSIPVPTIGIGPFDIAPSENGESDLRCWTDSSYIDCHQEASGYILDIEFGISMDGLQPEAGWEVGSFEPEDWDDPTAYWFSVYYFDCLSYPDDCQEGGRLRYYPERWNIDTSYWHPQEGRGHTWYIVTYSDEAPTALPDP